MPPDVVAATQAVLANGTDPEKIEYAATELAGHGYPIAAAALRSRSMELRVKLSAQEGVQNVKDQMEAPAIAPASPAPVPAQTLATAKQVANQAAELAATAPAMAAPAAQAATAATTAAQAAATQDPALALKAAKEAAAAAAATQSAPAVAAAAAAVQTAQQAVATGNPVAAASAAQQAANVAATVVMTSAATAAQQPIPVPAPASALALAASAMCDDIRKKGCWKENRELVRVYQRAEGGTPTVRGRAGKADGLYGPTTALAAMAHVPKVPAPCYWPTQPKEAAAAKASWAALVKQGKVTVGADLSAGGCLP